MTQSILSLVALVVALALLPWGLRWLRQRAAGGTPATSMTSKVVSAVAVGPQQRVVTVEVGPPEARVWLVLGVTAQAVTCLHRMAPAPAAAKEHRGDDAPTPLA